MVLANPTHKKPLTLMSGIARNIPGGAHFF